MFGAGMDLAFSSVPIYLREEQEVCEYTDGVSMTMSN